MRSLVEGASKRGAWGRPFPSLVASRRRRNSPACFETAPFEASYEEVVCEQPS